MEAETIEIRTFCSSCPPAIAECEPRKTIPVASISPELLKLARERGYMRSHGDCAFHFGQLMKAATDEAARESLPAADALATGALVDRDNRHGVNR